MKKKKSLITILLFLMVASSFQNVFATNTATSTYEEARKAVDANDFLDLSQDNFAESKEITELGKIDLSIDDTADNQNIIETFSVRPFYPNQYGVPIAGFNQTPPWIKRLPANKQNDIMHPKNTIPIGAGKAVRLNSNMTIEKNGSVVFTRIPNKITNYGNVVQYINDNAGYIEGRAIKSNTIIKMTSDSISTAWLGENRCIGVYPGYDVNTKLDGICFISMHPDQFSGVNSSIRTKPLNSFIVDVEIRYKDTNQIVDKPLDIYIADLDVLQSAFYVPEAIHFDSSVAEFSTYDRTQLRYNSTSTMSEFTKGFIGTPNNNTVWGDDSTFLRGGHAKTINGKFRVGFTDCNCSTFLNIGHPNYSPKPPTGKLTLKKRIADNEGLVSLCPQQYSLEGAEYSVYSDSTCTKLVGKLITTTQKKDANGKLYAETNALNLEKGTYYVKETKAPKGYNQEKNPVPITVEVGKDNILNVTEKPYTDPMTIRIQKSIPKGLPEFTKYLEGAEYTIKYYPDILNTESEVKAKTPMRTWVFRTDANGEIKIRDKWKVGGDPLFKNDKGMPVGLIGTYTIEETKAPSGFIKNNGIAIRHVKKDIPMEDIDATNTPIMSELPDNSINRKIEVTKKIAEPDFYEPYGIPSAIFELTGKDVFGNTIKLRRAIILDKSTLKNGYYTGKVTFDNLPAGEYTVREVKKLRYKLKGIDEVTANGTIRGENVDFELVNSVYGHAAYQNSIPKWDKTTHETCVVNHF